MNKEEIQSEIKVAEEHLAGLRKKLDEPEKPKLRHGDCVIEHDIPRVVLNRNKYKGQLASFSRAASDLNGYNYAEQHKGIVLFNIFDLLKDWSEPFRQTFVNDVLLEYSSRFDKAIFINSDHQHLTISEAEEIWYKFGHAIAELKRKQN